jgi:hypothetical protein
MCLQLEIILYQEQEKVWKSHGPNHINLMMMMVYLVADWSLE